MPLWPSLVCLSHFHEAAYSSCTRWRALFEIGDKVIETASFKLTNGESFGQNNIAHVLAVLSQRLCVEPVLANAEAIQLTDRSVAHHMRLLTGMASDRRTLYTYSPSEPVLVLGAVDILYKKNQSWGPVLETFSRELCAAGLVEKGLIGELGARTLLLIARDFAAPKGQDGGRDLLTPVHLLDFLDRLFGNDKWSSHRQEFTQAFSDSYVNFSHWVITKDSLPEAPDR
jgi:hypothetical protein